MYVVVVSGMYVVSGKLAKNSLDVTYSAWLKRDPSSQPKEPGKQTARESTIEHR